MQLVGEWVIIIIISILKRDLFYQKMSPKRASEVYKDALRELPPGLALNETAEGASGTSVPSNLPFQRQERFASSDPFQ